MTTRKSKMKGVTPQNIAAAINGVFHSMRLSAMELMGSKTKQENSKRFHEATTSHPHVTGARQAARIQRQIDKGQLKEANGLYRSPQQEEIQARERQFDEAIGVSQQ